MRLTSSLSLFVLYESLSYVGFVSAASPLVDLGYSAIRGARDTELQVDSYLGLRYAVAPIGNLRWRAPVPIELGDSSPFGDIFNATSHGPQCVQGEPTWWASVGALAQAISSGDSIPTSEDCLSLDVFTPSAFKNKSLPVVVYIHGGGYTLGNGANAGGPNFVHQSGGSVIFVSIQYRLGAYGFLSGDAVKHDGTANAALLDQRAAIDWVQRHIAAFGGDPQRVTLWGSSAGGGCVTAQMILRGGESNPPFSAGIAEYQGWVSYKSDDVLDTQYTDLLAASGCSTLACLRNLSYDELSNATSMTYQTGYEANRYAYGDFYYGISVDGSIIRDYPQNELRAGQFSRVPLMIDHTTYEGVAFTNFSTSTWNETVENLMTLWPDATATFFLRLEQLYPLSDFEGIYLDSEFFSSSVIQFLSSSLNLSLANNPEFWRAQQIYGDYLFNCPTYYESYALSERGVPVYKLVFDAGTQIHGASAAYLAGPPSESSNAQLAQSMQDYWISFVASHNPNAMTYSNASRPIWPLYTDGNGTEFVVLEATETSFRQRLDIDVNERCEFFQGRSSLVLN